VTPVNTSTPLSAEDVERVAEAAGRAPSVHNTQPWRITVRRGDLQLSADADRRLGVADPDGREMLISCGAALYNLLLALRHLGHAPDVRLLPDSDYPHQLAVVHPDGGGPGPEGDADRYAAIPDRHTHRGDFTAAPLPAGLIDRLRRAAAAEHAELTVYTDEADIRALATVTELASYIHARDGAYAAEHARWMRAPDTARADGINPADLPGTAPRGDPHFPPRFTDTTKPPPPAADTRATGTVAVLSTPADTPRAWLHTGQAMQRLLLDATIEGVAAAIHTQPLEIPHLREFIATEFTPGHHPQILLRLGHPTPEVDPTHSARRPARDIITHR